MNLPLANRLKKRLHVEIARLQDELVELLYAADNACVFHGGTAIWRCYGGNRFSEDLDFYGLAGPKADAFRTLAESGGLRFLKFKKTENLVFATVTDGAVQVRVEANFRVHKKPVLKPYEKADGSRINVLTLTPDDLLLEKAAAYRGRRFVRDLYDVLHLSGLTSNHARLQKNMREFSANLVPPVDERNLRAILYAGVVPTAAQLWAAIRGRWA